MKRVVGIAATKLTALPLVTNPLSERNLNRRSMRLTTAAVLASMAAVPVVTIPAAQASVYCDPGWTYAVTSNTTNTGYVVDRTSVTNSTGSTKVGAKFTADQSGTFTATASISSTAEASAAVFAKVSATVNGAITHSMTTTIGTSTESDVKPYSTLKADYRIVRENVNMKKYYIYSNCATSSPTYFSYAAPYRKNWRLYY